MVQFDSPLSLARPVLAPIFHWVGISAAAGEGLLCVLLALIASTALAGVARPFMGARTRAESRLRIQTWWLIFGGVAAAALLGRAAAIVALALMSFIALKEFIAIAPGREADRPALFMAFAAVPVQYLFVWMRWYGMFIVFIPVYAFLLLPARLALQGGDARGFLRSAGTLHWGLMATVFALSHLGYLLNLPSGFNGLAHWSGFSLLAFALVLSELSEATRFLARKLAARKFAGEAFCARAQAIGFAAGAGASAGAAAIAGPWMTPLRCWPSVAAGLLIAVGGFLGSATMAAIKRDLGAENGVSFLPGHGGALDRLDALVFAAPLFFHFLHYLCF